MPTYPTYKLGDVAEIILGQSPESKSYNTKGEGLPFFQGKSEFTDWFPVPNKWCTEPKKIAEPLDILLSVRAPVGPTNIAKEKCCIGRGLAAIRYPECYKYVLYYLRSVSKHLESKATGTTFSSISGDVIKNLPIPLPPLPTQHQIVSRIESLFAELDKAAEHLRTAQQQLKTYRQAVLNHWLNNDDGKWEMVKLGEVAEIVTGNTPPKKDMSLYGNDYPFYKPSDLNAGINTIHSEDNVSIKGFNASRKLPNGSILVTCIGATIGKTGLIHREGICNQQINAILPNDSFVPECLFYIVTSDSFQRQIKSNASATTLPILNKSKFSDLEFSLPPLTEQHRIVQEIESRLSQSEAAETSIAEALQKTEALRQSILKKAFSGEFDL
ncbi:MAG: restriction endonuclease subunit S [Bacteroidales bacterium]|nr:restriction endonuclease subunit S [Bacteroidales bacterium]